MQVEKAGGLTEFKDGATMADMERAIKDRETTAVHVYLPGQTVEIKGRKFRIGAHGHWVPVRE
jgi:hypothetical protein